MNKSKRQLHVTVTFTMPHDTTEVAHVTVPAQGSVAVLQRTVQDGLASLTGRISSIGVDGGYTIHEPFSGVNSPVQNYRFEIGDDGEFET